jgi:radical SAM superfamily enzyme YgiQ (UPF0313 family)
MKPFSTNPRVLLSTVCRGRGAYFGDALGDVTLVGIPRLSMPRKYSPGLRFIKQNVPGVEIMEYPTWREYVARLKEGWDVVGLSFYQYEIGDAAEMAAEARRHGAREIWAGNFGALDGRVSRFADRVVVGPGESAFAELFGRGLRDEDVEVPPIFGHISTIPGDVRHFGFGVLYTQRGCPYRCTFCQTPIFDRKRFHYDIESVDRVLRYYKRLGLNYIFIIDEFFGARPAYYDHLTRLLARYKLRWYCQTRAATAARHVDEWYERGLRFAHIGVESMNREVLNAVDKKQGPEEVWACVRASAGKPDLVRIAGYMIGYDNMTAADTIREALLFKRMGFDMYAVNVITPYPRTAFWDEIVARYGICDRTYRNFDSKHLVWRHPHVTPLQMRFLYKRVAEILNQPSTAYWKSLYRFARGALRGDGVKSLWRALVKDPYISRRINRRKAFFFPVRPRAAAGAGSGPEPHAPTLPVSRGVTAARTTGTIH